MTQISPLYRRTRAMALSFGLVLGLAAGAYVPQIAHAAMPAIKAPAKAKPRAKGKAVKPAPVAIVETLPTAETEQLAALERVHFGPYECEFGKSITVAISERHTGYATVTLGKQTWTMKPVASSTGAIRLEDVKGQTLLLQILTKSMLLDIKSGHRLVDGCVHPIQKAAEEELIKHPMPSNLDPEPAASAAAASAPASAASKPD